MPIATISVNIVSMLRSRLRVVLCRVVTADVKVAIAPEGPFVYPDVVVSCEERDRTSECAIRHPTLIVEVLSESTAAFDRGKKFAWYRGIESLREYVPVGT